MPFWSFEAQYIYGNYILWDFKLLQGIGQLNKMRFIKAI